MKRRDLIRHSEAHGCRLLREGGSHSIYENTQTNKRSSDPRHIEIAEYTTLKICKQLQIPAP
ncbi:MAG: type II toxin-antitoxin system HicA family toxin [Pyrinomonadaceae bacterium]